MQKYVDVSVSMKETITTCIPKKRDVNKPLPMSCAYKSFDPNTLLINYIFW